MQSQKSLEEKVILAVREFVDLIRSNSGSIADMSSLVDITSQLPLSNLDYWERLIRNEYASALEASKSKWSLFAKADPFFAWLDIISWDGYRREKALRLLTGAVPNRFFFALIIRRLNDWVPEVREAVRGSLPSIVTSSNPLYIVDALSTTLLHWNSWGRMGELDKQMLLSLISNKGIAKVIKEKIISSFSGPMTSVLTQVGRTSALDGDLSEIASKAVQPTVRARAYRSLLEGKMVWVEGREWQWTDIRYCEGRMKTIVAERNLTVVSSFLEILKMASLDHSPVVRKVAADVLINELDTLGDEALHLAKLFAVDASPLVAERGRFVIKQLRR